MKQNTHYLLNELNLLLSTDQNLDSIPQVRKHVDVSGRNQKWLLKNLRKLPNVNMRIISLLETPIQTLVK